MVGPVPPGSATSRLLAVLWLLAVAGYLAAATVLAYLAWLAWDQHYDEAPDGGLSGPYQAWQVIGLVLTIGLLAVVAGWRQHPILAVIAIPIPLTVCFAVDWATDTPNQGLWPIGVALIVTAAIWGVTLVSFVSAGLATRRARRRPASRPVGGQ